MKYNYWFLLSVFLLIHNSTFSQTHQIYGGAGYNFPTTTAVIGAHHTDDYVEFNLSTFSKGLVFQVGYLFGVNNNLELDLNINYLSGVTDEIYISDTRSSGTYEDSYVKYSNFNISVSPSVKVKFDVGDFSPYVKFGASINFIRLKTTTEGGHIARNFVDEYLYKGDYNFGWVAAIGLDYRFDPTFIGFIECQLNSITFYPDEIEITTIGIYTNSRTTVTRYPEDKIFYENSNESTTSAIDFPFSSIGIIMGLRVVL